MAKMAVIVLVRRIQAETPTQWIVMQRMRILWLLDPRESGERHPAALEMLRESEVKTLDPRIRDYEPSCDVHSFACAFVFVFSLESKCA
jgi:hypothetical protein